MTDDSDLLKAIADAKGASNAMILAVHKLIATLLQREVMAPADVYQMLDQLVLGSETTTQQPDEYQRVVKQAELKNLRGLQVMLENHPTLATWRAGQREPGQ